MINLNKKFLGFVNNDNRNNSDLYIFKNLNELHKNKYTSVTGIDFLDEFVKLSKSRDLPSCINKIKPIAINKAEKPVTNGHGLGSTK